MCGRVARARRTVRLRGAPHALPAHHVAARGCARALRVARALHASPGGDLARPQQRLGDTIAVGGARDAEVARRVAAGPRDEAGPVRLARGQADVRRRLARLVRRAVAGDSARDAHVKRVVAAGHPAVGALRVAGARDARARQKVAVERRQRAIAVGGARGMRGRPRTCVPRIAGIVGTRGARASRCARRARCAGWGRRGRWARRIRAVELEHRVARDPQPGDAAQRREPADQGS